MEEHVRGGKAIYCVGGARGFWNSYLWRNSPKQQEHCRVYLLPGYRHTRLAAESESAWYHRDFVRQFPFHIDRSVGAQLYRDPDSGGGLDGGSVSVSGPPASHTTDV